MKFYLVVILAVLSFWGTTSWGAEFSNPESDAQIVKHLKTLMEQSGWYPGVTLEVSDGVVVFRGVAQRKDQVQFLTAAAEKLPATLAVIDKVEVKAGDLQPMLVEGNKIFQRFLQLLPTFVVALLMILVSYFFAGFFFRVVRGAWRRRIENPFLLALVTRATLIPMWVILFYLALRTLGLPNVGATVIGGTGFLGILVGLAFKGIAENYLAGILLASRSPFTRGDLIQIGEYQGYVQNLNMRGTTIIDLNGNLILIPNIMVIQSVVENRTANPNMRTSFFVNISYQDSITKAQELIVKAMHEVKGVLHNPAPSVVVHELTPAAVRLKIRVWLDLKTDPEARVKSRAMIRTKETLLSHGMSIPDESREVVFADTLKVRLLKNDAFVDENERKTKIQKQAETNLAEAKVEYQLHESPKEELMDQADRNPLPGNRESSDLLPKKK